MVINRSNGGKATMETFMPHLFRKPDQEATIEDVFRLLKSTQKKG